VRLKAMSKLLTDLNLINPEIFTEEFGKGKGSSNSSKKIMVEFKVLVPLEVCRINTSFGETYMASGKLQLIT
jgi:hypothetical protein